MFNKLVRELGFFMHLLSKSNDFLRFVKGLSNELTEFDSTWSTLDEDEVI